MSVVSRPRRIDPAPVKLSPFLRLAFGHGRNPRDDEPYGYGRMASDVLILPQASHFAFLQAPELFAAALKRFLKTVPGAE